MTPPTPSTVFDDVIKMKSNNISRVCGPILMGVSPLESESIATLDAPQPEVVRDRKCVDIIQIPALLMDESILNFKTNIKIVS